MIWVVLLRGVNVGGKNKLPMKELRDKLIARGFCNDIQTYIQSGNLVLDSSQREAAETERQISCMIKDDFGFKPSAVALSAADFRKAAEANPFPEAVTNPKSLHLYFLGDTPSKPDLKSLRQLSKTTEQFHLEGKVFYLYAQEGIGRSKLAAGVEKKLGVTTTARNWNTVTKLLELVER